MRNFLSSVVLFAVVCVMSQSASAGMDEFVAKCDEKNKYVGPYGNPKDDGARYYKACRALGTKFKGTEYGGTDWRQGECFCVMSKKLSRIVDLARKKYSGNIIKAMNDVATYDNTKLANQLASANAAADKAKAETKIARAGEKEANAAADKAKADAAEKARQAAAAQKARDAEEARRRQAETDRDRKAQEAAAANANADAANANAANANAARDQALKDLKALDDAVKESQKADKNAFAALLDELYNSAADKIKALLDSAAKKITDANTKSGVVEANPADPAAVPTATEAVISANGAIADATAAQEVLDSQVKTLQEIQKRDVARKYNQRGRDAQAKIDALNALQSGITKTKGEAEEALKRALAAKELASKNQTQVLIAKADPDPKPEPVAGTQPKPEPVASGTSQDGVHVNFRLALHPLANAYYQPYFSYGGHMVRSNFYYPLLQFEGAVGMETRYLLSSLFVVVGPGLDFQDDEPVIGWNLLAGPEVMVKIQTWDERVAVGGFIGVHMHNTHTQVSNGDLMGYGILAGPVAKMRLFETENYAMGLLLRVGGGVENYGTRLRTTGEYKDGLGFTGMFSIGFIPLESSNFLNRQSEEGKK